MIFIYFLRIGDTFIVVAVVVSTIVISIAIAVVLRIVVSGTIVIANTTVVAGMIRINAAITKKKIFVIKKLMKSVVVGSVPFKIVLIRQLLGPSIDNKLGAGQEFSFASPSFVYGYQNKACFGIL